LNQEGVGGGKPKTKATKLAEQDNKGKTAQQWHNYACLQQSSAGQQLISQLTLIIGNHIQYNSRPKLEIFLLRPNVEVSSTKDN